MPAEQVRVRHAVSDPGHSEATEHPAMHTPLEHVAPGPGQSASIVHGGGVHMPATQLSVNLQAVPQLPQLVMSVCVLISQPFELSISQLENPIVQGDTSIVTSVTLAVAAPLPLVMVYVWSALLRDHRVTL